MRILRVVTGGTPVPLRLEIFWMERPVVELSIQPTEDPNLGGAERLKPTIY